MVVGLLRDVAPLREFFLLLLHRVLVSEPSVLLVVFILVLVLSWLLRLVPGVPFSLRPQGHVWESGSSSETPLLPLGWF